MRSARLVFVIVGVLAARPAFAQSEAAQAEALFRQGRELLAAGDTEAACAAFESSQRKQAAATTLLNIGGCREKNGQLATAWGAFVEASRLLRNQFDESAQQLLQIASSRAAALEPRLSKLAIKVDAERRVAGLVIQRGTDTVDPGTWNTSLPVDGGTYTITAAAPGREGWSTSVTVANEKDEKAVEIPVLVEAKQEPVPLASTVAPASQGSAPSRVPAIVVGAGAGALLLSALGFELAGRARYDDATDAGDAGDEATAFALWDQANTRRYVALGMLGAGVVAGGVAAYMFVRARRQEVVPVATFGRVRVAPMVTTTMIGIVGEL